MKSPIHLLSALVAVAAFSSCMAADAPSANVPTVTVSASATASVPNDRMYAWLRAETDNADPVRAAAEVNARMAKALARAKAVAGVEAATSGYSSYQISDPKQQSRWRVAQTLTLEGTDFAAMAALISKLQADDMLALSGMNFAVSPESRRRAEDALTQQAIRAWQTRARNAAQGFGFASWRTGHVTIQTGDFGRPQPMMRGAGVAYAASAPPVAVEAGNTDVTVTVNGEAVLEQAAPLPRQ